MKRKPALHRLSEHEFDLVASRFKALSEPNRLRLIALLSDGERTVSELVKRSGLGQTNVSRHLQQLQRAGILYRSKRGLEVYYGIGDPAIFQICSAVCGKLQAGRGRS